MPMPFDLEIPKKLVRILEYFKYEETELPDEYYFMRISGVDVAMDCQENEKELTLIFSYHEGFIGIQDIVFHDGDYKFWFSFPDKDSDLVFKFLIFFGHDTTEIESNSIIHASAHQKLEWRKEARDAGF